MSGKSRKQSKPYSSVQSSSVAQSCPTLFDPMNRNTPGLPIRYQLPEFTQTHVHWVSDAIQPSHPLSSSSPPAPNPPSISLFLVPDSRKLSFRSFSQHTVKILTHFYLFKYRNWDNDPITFLTIAVIVITQSLRHVRLFVIPWLPHTRLLCPSLSPGVCSDSCLLSQWCYLTISSPFANLFSICLQSFPASGSFPRSWLFPSGGQSIGASASASVLQMNTQSWFPLGLTG